MKTKVRDPDSQRKKERKNDKWLFFEHLVLAYTIELMDDLGLVR